jgi:hypothetical protein
LVPLKGFEAAEVWPVVSDQSGANRKVTVFLSSRTFALANREIRQEMLGSHSPALTVIIAGIFDEKWLLEIEAVAAA